MIDNDKNFIHDNVLKAIEAGTVTMRPKWHFVVRTALFAVGIVLASAAVLYLASFIIFILHQTGIWFAPGFGLRGVQEFLIGLPWLLVALAALFIIILQILVKRYSFSYGQPLLYSAIGTMMLVVVGAFVIALTPVHRGLFNQAQQDHLPIAGRFYRQYAAPSLRGNVVPGEIIEIVDGGYRILTPRDETIVVVVTPETRFPLGTAFEKGDQIVILGDRRDDMITAFGIREVTEDMVPPFRGSHRPDQPQFFR